MSRLPWRRRATTADAILDPLPSGKRARPAEPSQVRLPTRALPAVASEEWRKKPALGAQDVFAKTHGSGSAQEPPAARHCPAHTPVSLVGLQPVTAASGSTPTSWGSRASPVPRSSSLWQGFLCPTACHEQGVIPTPHAVPQPPRGTDASSVGAQGSQGKALLGWCCLPTPAYWVLRHLRGRVIGS